MHGGVRLFGSVLLGVAILNIPASPAFQTRLVDPSATPGVETASPSKQPVPAETPKPMSPAPWATPSASPIRDRETIIRLKIFLDQHSFGPGEIDDRWTDLCANALRLYQIANGNGAAGIDPELKQEL